MKYLIAAIISITFFLGISHGQAPKLNSSIAKEAVVEFNEKVGRLSKQYATAIKKHKDTFDTEVARRNKTLLGKLKEEFGKQIKSGKSDKAFDIFDAMQFYEKLSPRAESEVSKIFDGKAPKVKSSLARSAVAEFKKNVGLLSKQYATATGRIEKIFEAEAAKDKQTLLDKLKKEMAQHANSDEAKNIGEAIDYYNGLSPDAQSEVREIVYGAVSWNGNQYALVDGKLKKHLAKKYAEHLGGHLARIESREEHDFILKLIEPKEKYYKTLYYILDLSLIHI